MTAGPGNGDDGDSGVGGKGNVMQPVSSNNTLAAVQFLTTPWRMKT